VFAADVGPYERETDPEMTFLIGLCDSDGSNKEQQASFTTKGSLRVWFSISVSSIPSGKDSSALYFYIATASTNEWWADRMQVSKNLTRPGAFAPTSGSSIDRTDTASMTMRKVCERCREPLLSKTERFGRKAEQFADDPIDVEVQEI
jgi:hypothetical protein